MKVFFILFLLSFISFLFIYLYNKKEKTFEYESVIHPYLWSCLYKTQNESFINQYKSQYREDYVYNTNFFKNKLNGIYVELGALDGYTISNTFFYENYLGWSGLLIEGSVNSCYKLMNNKHLRPRSEIVCTAICKSREYVDFKQGDGLGGIKGELPSQWFGLENKSGILTKCSKISNILHQFHITHIDFFSLDVEGSEYAVIETFDFSIIVNYWVIEFNGKDNDKNKRVREMLKENGYVKCKIELDHNNECYVYPNYQYEVKNLIEIENKYRTNFGSKCGY